MASNVSSVLELTERTFDQAVADGLTIVDFWAPWCGPCRMQAPVLEEIAAEFAGRVRVAKVNVDANGALAARFRVQAIPLLVFLKDGREVTRLVGLQNRADLVDAISRLG